MSRSKYIYVVTDRHGLVAAFTVRRELQRWLGLFSHVLINNQVEVTRVRDGSSAIFALNPRTLEPVI